MSSKPKNLSREKKEKSMLDQLLDTWELNYNGFADYLEIDRRTLWKYRTGKLDFKLDWQQIQKLQQLLKRVGKDFSDLPSDWIRDK
jgi:hypothetical protein